MDGRKPELDLKATCPVGGKPGALYMTPDAAQLLVFDQTRSLLSFVGISGWSLLEQVELSPAPTFRPFLLAGFEESLYLGGLPGMVGVFNTVTRRFSGAIPCGGQACDLALFPETRQALLSTTQGSAGRLDRISFSPRALHASLDLPGVPARGTLVVSPDRSVAAVSLPGAVAFFPSDLHREAVCVPVRTPVRSLAFDAEGGILYAACPEESSVAVIDLRQRQVVDRLLMTGRPFQLESDPQGRRLWVLCEQIGHLAVIDGDERAIVRRVQLAGLDAAQNRLSFSPERRLAAVAELHGRSLALIATAGPRCGELSDRLELGREIGASVWSPLGEEIYVSDPGSGELLAFHVNRPADETKDTSLYLEESLRRQSESLPQKNPLFPP